MMRALRLMLASVLLLALIGCQAILPEGLASQASLSATKGAIRSAADTRPHGFLKLAIMWPTLAEQRELGYRAQLIPDSAAEMDIRVFDGSTEVGSALDVTRTAGPLTNVTIELRAKNNLSVDVKVYPAGANAGTQIASGAASGVNIYSSADTSATVTLVPGYVPAISSLSSGAGAVDASITLTGTNFKNAWGATPTVYFNGTAATPTSASNTSITVAVPSGATTGNITVKADNVTSVSTANYYVLSGIALTAANVTINGHTTGSDGLVAGMVYYGGTLDFTAVGTFVLKSGETLTSSWTNPPAPSWSSANANNTIVTNSGPTIASTTTTTVGRMTAAANNQTGDITAIIGPVTSNAILAQAVGVDSVTLNAASLTLNAMPPTGVSNGRHTTASTVTATVNSTLPFNDGVTWSDGGSGISRAAETTAQTTVATAAGTAAGSSTLSATSITTPAKDVTINITITDFGDLVLGIQ